jgi:hypothetical protein
LSDLIVISGYAWRRQRQGEREGEQTGQASSSSWAEICGVEVAEGEDDVLILTGAVVIDMICHDDRKE